MKTVIFIIFISLIIGCAFDNRNSQNVNQNSFKVEPIKKSYVICTMKCSIPRKMDLDSKMYEDYETKTFVSGVKEVLILTTDAEYRLLDDFESEIRKTAVFVPNWEIKILSRQCLKYSSYAEASQARINLLN